MTVDFKDVVEYGDFMYEYAYQRGREDAIEALNKQIPQRCDESDDGIYCPVCGARMAGDWNYCPSCGQRLEYK